MKFIFFFLLTISVGATTIVPFESFSDLREASDKVVYLYQDRTAFEYKTRSILYPAIEIKKYAPDNAVIWGDFIPEANKEYLLFLDANNRPICLSFYVFEVSGPFLQSIQEGDNMLTWGEDKLRGTYYLTELINALLLDVDYPTPLDNSRTLETPPSHCTFFQNSFGRYIRYQDPNLKVYYADTSVAYCAGGSYSNLLISSSNTINTNYLGVSYIPEGFISYTTDCSDGTALGSEFIDFLYNGLGSTQTCLVFFQDPCSEISDLIGCSGTLAFGGTYFDGTYIFEGDTFARARFPFVVFNNGLATCHCSNMATILTHELTHTFGIGHIGSGFGQANMNPSCCSSITDLDRECLNFYYPFCSEDNTFTGAVSNNWFTAANWSLGTVPDSCSNVFIHAPDSVIIQGGDAKARTMEVDSNAILQVISNTLIIKK